MTGVGVTKGTRVARTPTRSQLCCALLVVALALAPALTPYLLTPTFAPQNEVAPTYARIHVEAHAGRSTKVPNEDPGVHPHCLRCVLFAASLPAKVVLMPSTSLVGKPLQLDVGLPPILRFNPNVGARAPPEGDIL